MSVLIAVMLHSLVHTVKYYVFRSDYDNKNYTNKYSFRCWLHSNNLPFQEMLFHPKQKDIPF